MLDGVYETMSISTGLYPNLDLWNANKFPYVTLHILSICVSKFSKFELDVIMLVSSAYKRIFVPIIANFGKSFV